MRIALQISENVVAMACQLAEVEDTTIFDNLSYAIVEVISPTEYAFKLVNEDEIFEAVKNDSEMHIISL